MIANLAENWILRNFLVCCQFVAIVCAYVSIQMSYEVKNAAKKTFYSIRHRVVCRNGA